MALKPLPQRWLMLLNFGNDENKTVASATLISSVPRFPKPAVQDLADWTKECYLKYSNTEPEDPFDVDAYMNYVYNLVTQTRQSFRTEWQYPGVEPRWVMTSIERAVLITTPIQIVLQAEMVFAALIGHSPDPKVSRKTILGEKKQRKNGIYSFY